MMKFLILKILILIKIKMILSFLNKNYFILNLIYLCQMFHGLVQKHVKLKI